MKSELFLKYGDAVKVAVACGIDEQIARQEMMQKCYLPDSSLYEIGYDDGVSDSIAAIRTYTKAYSE